MARLRSHRPARSVLFQSFTNQKGEKLMKTLGTLGTAFFAALLLFFVAEPPRASAATEVSIDLFYNALEPHGEWLEVSDYGYVWHPNGVGRDWRPYTEGHWVFTDAGWTFVSDEPWAWA